MRLYPAPPELHKMKIAVVLLVFALAKAATIPRQGGTLSPLQRLKQNMESIQAVATLAAGSRRVSAESFQVSDGLLGAADDPTDDPTGDPGNPCATAAGYLEDDAYRTCQDTFSQFIGAYEPKEADIEAFCSGGCHTTLKSAFSQVAETGCTNITEQLGPTVLLLEDGCKSNEDDTLCVYAWSLIGDDIFYANDRDLYFDNHYCLQSSGSSRCSSYCSAIVDYLEGYGCCYWTLEHAFNNDLGLPYDDTFTTCSQRVPVQCA